MLSSFTVPQERETSSDSMGRNCLPAFARRESFTVFRRSMSDCRASRTRA